MMVTIMNMIKSLRMIVMMKMIMVVKMVNRMMKIKLWNVSQALPFYIPNSKLNTQESSFKLKPT